MAGVQCAAFASLEKYARLQWTFDSESSMIDVDALIVFSAVMDAGSFSRAAERLGQTPSGVSRTISRLEAQPGHDADPAHHAAPATDGRRRLAAGAGADDPGRPGQHRGRSGGAPLAAGGPGARECRHAGAGASARAAGGRIPGCVSADRAGTGQRRNLCRPDRRAGRPGDPHRRAARFDAQCAPAGRGAAARAGLTRVSRTPWRAA